ncbi:uncharacterized protein LOC108829340 [Raphanus sativus]|uniref:Uncharacterized protein LOC108829340 n=1 Tax=Raphanus sativus TaxID=3726 RepID=A0A6J0LF67_RAPSA|nr:uncharacterized protein LOC108829340 [Raphanus sativus]
MRALNANIANRMNSGWEQIHQQLDAIEASQPTQTRTGAQRDRPRRNNRSDDDIQGEDFQLDDDRSINRPRRGHRNRTQGDINPFAREDRADNGLQGLKLKIPPLEGKNDPDAFLEWERKIELVFDCQNFSELKKVRLAATEFSGYAINWYDQVVTNRRRNGGRPIASWDELTTLMRRRFVPEHYHRDLHQRLRRLLQGTKSVEDYFQEMETLMIKADVDETLEATMARFLAGLNRDIQDRMELQDYESLNQMLHKAILIEQQTKRKSYSKPGFAPKPAFAPKLSYQDKGNSSSTTNIAFKTDVPARFDKRKAVETPSRARDIRCFKCQVLGHYANKCPNQRVMILMENGEVESEDEKEDEEDSGPVFDDDEVPYDYPHHGPLLVARKPLDDPLGPIFDKEDDHSVDESGLIFDADSGPIFDEEDIYDYPAHGPLLVTRRSLSVQPKTNEKEQRENLFHSRCLVFEEVCSLIIDGGSCTNVASYILVRKLRLVTRPLSRPFRLEWLNEAGEQFVKEQVTIPFTIGRYEDEVVCNVLPMDACHTLLGRPWHFDKKAVHDGFTNRHSFGHNGKKITLVPLTPLEVHQDQLQLKRSREKEPKPKEPETSKRNSNFYLKESQVWKSVCSQKPFLLLVYKESLMATSSDLAPDIPSELKDVLQDFTDVFPDDNQQGLPPIRGIEHQIDFVPGASLPNRPA